MKVDLLSSQNCAAMDGRERSEDGIFTDSGSDNSEDRSKDLDKGDSLGS